MASVESSSITILRARLLIPWCSSAISTIWRVPDPRSRIRRGTVEISSQATTDCSAHSCAAGTINTYVTDYITTPFRAYFMHTNARHHSVALIETGKQDLHHLMVELFSLDDVGQGYDIALGDCLWHIYRMIGKLSGRIYLLTAPPQAGPADSTP